MHEVAVGSASGFSFNFNLDLGRSESEIFGMKKIVNCTGIVDCRIFEILTFEIGLLEIPEKRR